MRNDGEIFPTLRKSLQRLEKRNRHWLTDDDDKFRERFVSAVAAWVAAVFEGVTSLRLVESLRNFSSHGIRITSETAKGFSVIADVPVLRRQTEILAVRNALDRLESKGVARVFEISDLLIDGNLPPRAEDYLGRVARLYMFGFDAEAVVLARSALEAALEERLSDDDVREAVTVVTPTPTLANRITAARTLRRLSHRAANDAHSLRVSGNDVLHVAGAAHTISPLDAIKALGRVLAELYKD